MQWPAQLPGLTLGIEGIGDGERVGIGFDHGVEEGIEVRNSIEIACG